MKPSDTLAEIEEIQLDIIRKMSPEKRLELAIQLYETEQNLLSEGIRSRHPEYTEEEIRLALIRILLGNEQFEVVYPYSKGIKP